MFQGLAIPFAIETQRASLVRRAVRNLVATTGDDILIAVAVYEPDGTATDISGGAITLTVVSAADDPGSWGYGIGWGGFDYGRGGFSSCDRVIYQTAADLTEPECGQAVITIPREASANWRGRYRMMVSLDSEYGGSVQTYGVLDVRRGAYIPRLGTAGYVSIADAVMGVVGLLDEIGIVDASIAPPAFADIGVLGPSYAATAGFLDGIGVVDGRTPQSTGIGVLGASGGPGPVQPIPTPQPAGQRVARFIVTLDSPAEQTVLVRWATVDGTATAPVDYDAAEGVLIFTPGMVRQRITIPVHHTASGNIDTQFCVHLWAGNGAVVVRADGIATLAGFVGILDNVSVVDGTLAPFRPGLVAVLP
jgi:hypothetical protein